MLAFLTMVYARACCLQGGGVAVGGGTVTFQSCEIHDNTAGRVRAHHLPDMEATPSPPMGCLLFDMILWLLESLFWCISDASMGLGNISLLVYRQAVHSLACKPTCSPLA